MSRLETRNCGLYAGSEPWDTVLQSFHLTVSHIVPPNDGPPVCVGRGCQTAFHRRRMKRWQQCNPDPKQKFPLANPDRPHHAVAPRLPVEDITLPIPKRRAIQSRRHCRRHCRRHLQMGLWRDALTTVEPGSKPPEAPESLRLWSAQTLYGTLGGTLFGGYQGLVLARNARIPSPVPSVSRRHRAAAFFVRESIFGGARIGAFTSLFSGLALGAAAARGEEGPANYAAAGAGACAMFGAAVGGWGAVPAAAAFGGVCAGVLAAGREALVAFVESREEKDPKSETAMASVSDTSVVDTIVALEDSMRRLRASPLPVERNGKDTDVEEKKTKV